MNPQNIAHSILCNTPTICPYTAASIGARNAFISSCPQFPTIQSSDLDLKLCPYPFVSISPVFSMPLELAF